MGKRAMVQPSGTGEPEEDDVSVFEAGRNLRSSSLDSIGDEIAKSALDAFSRRFESELRKGADAASGSATSAHMGDEPGKDL